MNKFHLRTTTPFTRFNNDIALIPNHWEVLIRHQAKFLNQNFQHPSISGSSNDQKTRFNAEFLNQSFIYLITETVCDYPYTFFTEKTWRAMVTGRPFMMVNAQHSLKKLQEFGFQTFSDWWDESYDEKALAADRIESMVSTLKSLASLSKKELRKLNQDMLPVIQHNQNHLIKFASDDLENIANQI
jgi:hypothetical protein